MQRSIRLFLVAYRFCILYFSKKKHKPAKKNYRAMLFNWNGGRIRKFSLFGARNKTTKIVTYPLFPLASSNVALEFGNLWYMQEQRQDSEIHRQHRDMLRIEAEVTEACWRAVASGLEHLVYSAAVDWNTNFRPTSSGESETFLFAVTCKWESADHKSFKASTVVGEIQKSACHKEPSYMYL